MGREKKQFAIALAAVAAVCLAFTGCSQTGGGTPSGNADSGNLNFVYMGDATQQKAFNALFAEFNKDHPKIKLKAVGIPSGNWATFSTTVATRLAGGEKIDIIQVATEGQRLFASKGILENLDPFIDRDKDAVDDYYSDINPNLKKFSNKFASGPKGETVFIPGGFNTMGMYLNKDVFAAAGVPIPADGKWTWDQFVADGKKIKEKTGAYITAVGSGYFTDVMPWLTTNGASTFNSDWTKPSYNSAAAIKSAEFARSLVEMGLSPQPGGQFDGPSAYKQGKLAILGGGRWPVLSVRDLNMVGKTVVVNWPAETRSGSPVGWDAWDITKNSQNKAAAWTFIKFLMSKQAGEYFAKIGGTTVPARQSVAKSPAFTDNAPEGSVRLSEAMSFATPIPSIDQGAQAQKVIEQAWATIIAGQGGAKPTLDAAQAALESLLRD